MADTQAATTDGQAATADGQAATADGQAATADQYEEYEPFVDELVSRVKTAFAAHAPPVLADNTMAKTGYSSGPTALHCMFTLCGGLRAFADRDRSLYVKEVLSVQNVKDHFTKGGRVHPLRRLYFYILHEATGCVMVDGEIICVYGTTLNPTGKRKDGIKCALKVRAPIPASRTPHGVPHSHRRCVPQPPPSLKDMPKPTGDEYAWADKLLRLIAAVKTALFGHAKTQVDAAIAMLKALPEEDKRKYPMIAEKVAKAEARDDYPTTDPPSESPVRHARDGPNLLCLGSKWPATRNTAPRASTAPWHAGGETPASRRGACVWLARRDADDCDLYQRRAPGGAARAGSSGTRWLW